MNKKLFSFVFILIFILLSGIAFAEQADVDRYEISPTILGAYRKSSVHWEKLKLYLDKYESEYGVSGLNLFRVLKAITINEAGSNRTLVSVADAHDLMQVIERTRIYMGKEQAPGVDPMKKFSVGDEVLVASSTGKLWVRNNPGLKEPISGRTKYGLSGTVVGGPVFQNKHVWWKIQYENGLKGWSAGVGLAKDLSFNEAGVKYLAYLTYHLREYLVHKYGDFSVSRLHSLIVAGYNGGLSTAKGREVRVETYQYRIAVSVISQVLFQMENEIKKESEKLRLETLKKPHSWVELAKRFNISVVELRLFNPFLAARYFNKIPVGETIVYPQKQMIYFEAYTKEGKTRHYYVIRYGDVLHHVANAFFRTPHFSSIPPSSVYDALRDVTGGSLWGILYPGVRVDITDSPYLK